MTKRRIRLRLTARGDLATQYRWLVAEAGVDVAERFIGSVDAALETLAERPLLGPRVGSSRSKTDRTRKWKVPGFPKAVLIYQPGRTTISLVRVFHASQDWWRLIAD